MVAPCAATRASSPARWTPLSSDRSGPGGRCLYIFPIFFRCRGLKSIFVNVDVDLDHFRQYRSPDDEEQCEKVVGFWHFRESSSGSLSIAS